jgi:shikimate kinase
MKQLAVEWLVANLDIDLVDSDWCIQQAKEMEKQQIIDFAIWFNYTNTEYLSYEQIIEQYYNETFKKQ